MVANVTLEMTNDPNIRVYHTRFELCSTFEEGSRGSSGELSEFSNLMLEIRGVAHVRLLPYVLMIFKAPLFDWTEVEPKVIDLLSSFAKSQEELLNFTKLFDTAVRK